MAPWKMIENFDFEHLNEVLGATQKQITYAEHFVGKLISRNITYSFADLPPIRTNFWNL